MKEGELWVEVFDDLREEEGGPLGDSKEMISKANVAVDKFYSPGDFGIMRMSPMAILHFYERGSCGHIHFYEGFHGG